MVAIDIPKNAFHRTLVGMNYDGSPPCQPDVFSRACVEAYRAARPQTLGYPFTQIFEVGVLREVALLEQVPPEEIENLDYRPTAAIEDLRLQLDCRAELSAVERINLASMLISVSRFDAAQHALPLAVDTAQQRFELAWADFLISNRRDDGAASEAAFSRMIAAIEEGGVTSARTVDACTQGIVWYLKRREINDVQFRWCVGTGRELVVQDAAALGGGTISSWYRGLAMLPAALRDGEKTQRYMTRAYDHALRVASEGEERGSLNSLKTYYESCIKQFLHVQPDLELAERAGLALIALDAHWAPSFAELAEVYESFGKIEKAAQHFEKAVVTGPPYVGHHLVRAARARARLDDVDAALEHFRTVIELAPALSLAIAREALNLATRFNHGMQAYFRDALRKAAQVDA